MNILKRLILVIVGGLSILFLESCSSNDPVPQVTLEYQLEEGLLNNVTGLVEEEARTVWLSSADGTPLTDPVIAPAGEIISIDIPDNLSEFTVHEIIQYPYENSVLTILYSTAEVTPGKFIRKELNDNFRRGEEIGKVTFRALERPDNSAVSFSAAGYSSSSVWKEIDETFELPVYEHANYAFILLAETTNSVTERKIFLFTDLSDGDIVDVDFRDTGIAFDTYDYSDVVVGEFAVNTFSANAYETPGIYLDGEMRLPSGSNTFYVPKNVDGLQDLAFSFSASDDEGKFYSMEYFGFAPTPESFQLPAMDISISNPDLENLVVNIEGERSYFDYRTIQGQFGDPVINLWLSLSETPDDFAFPELPQEIKGVFGISGVESFSGTSTVYQSIYFDHLSYSDFLNRNHGRDNQEVYNGINEFRGYVRIIE